MVDLTAHQPCAGTRLWPMRAALWAAPSGAQLSALCVWKVGYLVKTCIVIQNNPISKKQTEKDLSFALWEWDLSSPFSFPFPFFFFCFCHGNVFSMNVSLLCFPSTQLLCLLCFLCVCVFCLHVHMCIVCASWLLGAGVGSLGTGITGSCKLSCG